MSRRLFERTVNDLQAEYAYFRELCDTRGKRGFSLIQKCTSPIRQLAYRVAFDSLDEYLRMGDKTARDCLQNFRRGIIELYGRVYLRKPTYTNIQEQYEEYHGFPSMLGSVDCTHCVWANCPVAWRGQFMRGDHEDPTIMLEAFASHDLWIWHAYFGIAGFNNDINVLNQLPIFNDIYDGKAPKYPFEVNRDTYKHINYLVDGIYPEWATFVKLFTCPQDDKRKKFISAQKDVERAQTALAHTS